MRPLLLVPLLACIPLAACKHRVVKPTPAASANTLVEGTFITGSGSWSHRQGNIGRELTLNLRGKDVSWQYNQVTYMPNGGRSSGGSGSSKRIADNGTAAWFLFVESPDRLWFFDGKEQLVVLQGRNYNLNETGVIAHGKLLNEGEQVPADVIPRLPADMQKLLPKPAAPTGRPSI